jgi:hypothetical protein
MQGCRTMQGSGTMQDSGTMQGSGTRAQHQPQPNLSSFPDPQQGQDWQRIYFESKNDCVIMTLSRDLSLFANAIRTSPEMRRLLSQAQTPGEIVDIASHCGYSFTVRDLQRASKDLAASHWAWGGKDRYWKQSFFSQHSGQRSQVGS